MRLLVTSMLVCLSACASTASADRRCEEMEARLAETSARLDETTARLGETSARLDETTARLDEATRRIAELDARLEQPPAADSTSEVAAPDGPDLDRILSCKGGRCSITRAGLEELFANPSWLATQARLVPSVREGVAKGFKVYGIRPRSLPHRLAFENGDLVVSINGHPLGSLDQTMQAYDELRKKAVSKVEFEVRRRDEAKTVTLHIE